MDELNAVINRHDEALTALGVRQRCLLDVLREMESQPDRENRTRSAEHAAADRAMRDACHEWLQASDQYIGALPTICHDSRERTTAAGSED
jgi:hypothetical protein